MIIILILLWFKIVMIREKEMFVIEKVFLIVEIGELSLELVKYKGENFDY